jgi:stage III sporulation protein AG
MDKMRKIIKKFKNIFNKDNKKLGENLVIMMIIGIIIIIAGGSLFGDDKKKEPEIKNTEPKKLETLGGVGKLDEKTELEIKVEEILSQINGAGVVKVLITYESGAEIVPFTNIKKSDEAIDERDSAGGTRKSNQTSYESSIVYEEEGSGIKKPIIVKEVYPKVKGVVVVADGGGDLTIRENLLRAVQVLLDVPVHKVQIYERKK